MIQIRLKKISSQKDLIYYIIVQRKHSTASRGFIEKIGSYKPHTDKWNNKYIFLNSDRLLYWIAKGANMNNRLFALLKPVLGTYV